MGKHTFFRQVRCISRLNRGVQVGPAGRDGQLVKVFTLAQVQVGGGGNHQYPGVGAQVFRQLGGGHVPQPEAATHGGTFQFVDCPNYI